MIQVRNNGADIVETNYWETDAAKAGKIFCSCNNGAIRLLLPVPAESAVPDMQAAKEIVLSRGPWPEARIDEAVEILFDDGSDSPFALHLTHNSFDLFPAEPPTDQSWAISVWCQRDGAPHKVLDRPCHWRRVCEIPCLEPWTP